jgi:nitrogen regulatory protein P-II 2
MKHIVAMIEPHQLDDVREALSLAGVVGLTVTEAKGVGRQKGHTEIYRGAEYETTLLPKDRIEVAVGDEQADAAIDAIRTAANTGTIGDGKIFVMELGGVTRIRTGETGDNAL